MPALLALVIVGSTAWLAIDASKRDWKDNSFAKNVPTWVIGSLLLWIVVFPLYVFGHRNKAPLLDGKKKPAKPKPARVQPAAASNPVPTAMGPSLDEVELEPVVEIEPEPVEPEPVVEIAPEPAVEIEPVIEIASFSAPEPALEHEPELVVEIEPAPVVEIEPIVEIEPEPIVEITPEPAVEIEPVIEITSFAPEPAVEIEPEIEPEPVDDEAPAVDWAALAAADASVQPEEVAPASPDPSLLPVEETPPGLSFAAFENVKPVSFGGFDQTADEPEPVPEASEPEPEPEPVVATEPDQEPGIEIEREPVIDLAPEPVVAFEPVVALEPKPEPVPAGEEAALEPFVAAVDADAEAAPAPRKRGSKLNPEIRLPSLRKRKARPGVEPVVATQADAQPAPKPAKAKRGFNPELKLPSFGKKKGTTPVPAPLTDDELVMLEVLMEMGPLSADEVRRELEGGTLEEIETVLHSLTRKQRAQAAPRPSGTGLCYSVAEDQPTAKAAKKKRGFNPELKLPSFKKSKKPPQPVVTAEAAAPAEAPKKQRGFNPELKLPKLSLSRKSASPGPKKSFITLPPNLQGPLNDLERKIALGSVVAIVVAAGAGYMSAPKSGDEIAAPPPPAAPASATR